MRSIRRYANVGAMGCEYSSLDAHPVSGGVELQIVDGKGGATKDTVVLNRAQLENLMELVSGRKMVPLWTDYNV